MVLRILLARAGSVPARAWVGLGSGWVGRGSGRVGRGSGRVGPGSGTGRAGSGAGRGGSGLGRAGSGQVVVCFWLILMPDKYRLLCLPLFWVPELHATT